jgi:hypothetical protein
MITGGAPSRIDEELKDPKQKNGKESVCKNKGGWGPRQVVECNEEGVLEGTICSLRMMFLATKMSS